MKKIVVLLLFVLSSASLAQSSEEIVVTGIRASADEMPGVTLKRLGDFLLLEVELESDSREAKERQKEIYSTIKNAISLAEKDKNIKLSLVRENSVVPLTMDNHEVDLATGSRPDTSVVTIQVKSPIPKDTVDPGKLILKLRKFTQSVSVVGRVHIDVTEETSVSIVNPAQYRSEILKLVTTEIETVTSSLGDDYRVILMGVDKPIKWNAAGPLHLRLFIPYTYAVIPVNLHTWNVIDDY